jgi:hypothetical protein
MDLREIGWVVAVALVVVVVEWIHLAQDMDQWWALVNTVMYLWVPVPQI